MADIITFIPQRELSAAKNLKGFIDVAKNQLHVFGEDLDFSQDQWDSSKINRVTKKPYKFTFSTLDTCGSRTKWIPMAEPYLSFAKAKIRYDFGLKPDESHNPKMAAIRAIEKALVEADPEGIPNAQDVTPHILNRAAQYLMDANPGSAYNSGCHLEMIGRFLFENQMTGAGYTWENIIEKKEDCLTKINEAADTYKIEKMLSKAAIRALPQIYHNAISPKDILISSMAAVMFSSPERGSEVLTLPVACEHTYLRDDGSEMYGLRWYTSKGALPEVRKILKSMKDLCKEAIGRIREVTKEGRKIARWYVAHPNKIYLPVELAHLRDNKYIRSDDLACLLGMKSSNSSVKWARDNGLKAVKVKQKNNIGAASNTYRIRIDSARNEPRSYPVVGQARPQYI